MNEFNPLRDAVPLAEVKRALIIKLRHHGDVLVASPVFSVLKAHAPQVEIDALVYADTAEMLTLHPAINTVHTIGRQWKKLGPLGQLRAEMALYRSLEARGYDLIIHLTEHWRGAWLCRLLKPRWSVGPSVGHRFTQVAGHAFDCWFFDLPGHQHAWEHECAGNPEDLIPRQAVSEHQ